jgi:hypothetical protein
MITHVKQFLFMYHYKSQRTTIKTTPSQAITINHDSGLNSPLLLQELFAGAAAAAVRPAQVAPWCA